MKELKTLNKFFYKYRFRLFLGLVFVVLSNIFAIYPAQFVRESFDLLKEQLVEIKAGDNFQHRQVIKTVAWYGFLILIFALLKGVFMFLMRQSIIVMSRLMEGDLKDEIYNHYQQMDITFFKRNKTGDLMARISEDVSRVRMYIGPAIMYIANLLSTFVLVIITMINVNPKLTLYVLTPLPFLSFVIYKVSSTINKKSEQLQQRLSLISSFAQESFAGIRIIKSFSIEEKWTKRFDEVSEAYRLKAMELNKTDSFFTPAVASIVGLSTIIIVYFGGKAVESAEVTTGNIAEFIIYVNLLIWPVTSLGWVSSLIQRAAASQKRINEFLNTKSEITYSSGGDFQLKGEIEFKNVSFTYPDTGIEAIKNLSFKLKPGESLGVMGKTGSGKSSLSSLLFRFYDVSKGEVLIDGINIKNLNLGSFRNYSALVPQDPFLFSDTIYNNITFGIKNTDIERVKEVCKTVAVLDNIESFPLTFDTLVGERGVTLSGGQKQRITIARALIKSPRLLVLDDCLSAVDADTESIILSGFKKMMQERTTILISHRIATVKDATQIIVLEDGKILEQGTHEELLGKKGYYFDLNEKQRLQAVN